MYSLSMESSKLNNFTASTQPSNSKETSKPLFLFEQQSVRLQQKTTDLSVF